MNRINLSQPKMEEPEEEVDEGRERTLRSDIKPREQMMSRHGGANRILR